MNNVKNNSVYDSDERGISSSKNTFFLHCKEIRS
jgi:hypothetical protein